MQLIIFAILFIFLTQTFHYKWIWEMFWATPGFMNKMKVLFYGPGWAPGKPRTGLEEDIPDVS